MHRVHSKATLYRFRFAALLLCLKYILVAAVVGLLGYSLVIHDVELTYISLELGGLTIAVALLQWLMGSQTRCPLCLTPVLTGKGCSKHRNARTILGSHRFRVALGILFRRSFMCPYCHEPTAMEVRERRR